MLVHLPEQRREFLAARPWELRVRRNALTQDLRFLSVPSARMVNLAYTLNPGLVYLIATSGVSYVGSEYGQAALFGGAGSGDEIRFTDTAHSIGTFRNTPQKVGQTPHTWLFRFRARAVATRGGLLQYAVDNDGVNGIYAFLEASDQAVRYGVKAFDGNNAISPQYTLNKWHTVVMTYDPVSNAVNAYLDGRRGTEGTEASPTTDTGTDDWYLGNSFRGVGYNREFDGEIALVGYWDRALTHREAMDLTRAYAWLDLFEAEESVFFPTESAPPAGGWATGGLARSGGLAGRGGLAGIGGGLAG